MNKHIIPDILDNLYCKDTVPKSRNKYSQEWNCAASFPITKLMYLWAIYIFPRSVHLFWCSRNRIKRSQVFEWEWIGNEASQFHFSEDMNRILFAVCWDPTTFQSWIRPQVLYTLLFSSCKLYSIFSDIRRWRQAWSSLSEAWWRRPTSWWTTWRTWRPTRPTLRPRLRRRGSN